MQNTERALAKLAMDEFEQHLYRSNRVEPESDGYNAYNASQYSHLLEAMIIAFLAHAAFVRRYLSIDVHSMSRRCLSQELCQPFFAGNESFIDAFCEEMKSRAKTAYATPNHPLRLQYRDVEKGIAEVNPYGGIGGGAPFE